MTKAKQISETQLADMYLARKAATHPPSAIKRQVLRVATKPKVSAANCLQRLQYVTMALSTLLLVGVVVMHRDKVEPMPSALHYTTVELHSMESESHNQFAHLTVDYTSHSKRYQQQQAVMIAHHNKQAVLHRTTQGWELQTCDQQLLAVSKDLIDKMLEMKSVDDNIKAGDSVNIQFNQAGMIVSILPAKQTLVCS